MNATTRNIPHTGADAAFAGMTPQDTARYTKELLESLRGIAVRQEQFVLAGLLEAAIREAKKLAVASC
jgi:hypothetical protein